MNLNEQEYNDGVKPNNRLLTDPLLHIIQPHKVVKVINGDRLIKSPSALINNKPVKSGWPHPMAVLSSVYATEESSFRKNPNSRSVSARMSCDIPSVTQFSQYKSLRPAKHLRASNRSVQLTEIDIDLPSTPGSNHNSLGRKSQGSINASLSQPNLYLDDQIQRYKAVLPPETFNRIASENEEKF